MKVLCVIPARYASTRLPGKPLALIAGKPMIQHTYMRACEAEEPDDVIVATDNEKVYDTVTSFGGKAVMTSPDHPSGTDRLAEVAMQYPDVDVIINVQGDEPMIDPDIIDRLAKAFEGNDDLKMATMKVPMKESEYNDPAAVKVVTDDNGYALYFSRSLIRIRATRLKACAFINMLAFMLTAVTFCCSTQRWNLPCLKRWKGLNSCARWKTAIK